MLAAGDGGRLGRHTTSEPKPLVPVHGRPLVAYTLDALEQAGVDELVVVTGYRANQLVHGLRAVAPRSLRLRFVQNDRFLAGASLSLRAAQPLVSGSFLLTMSDHLLSPELVSGLIAAATDPVASYVAADSSLRRDAQFVAEATQLQLAGRRVRAIGKELDYWDALDAGAFLLRPGAWAAADAVAEDCELSVIFSELARRQELYAADISGAFWYDVDTAEDLAAAARLLPLPAERAAVGA